jgi:hypothetical protein
MINLGHWNCTRLGMTEHECIGKTNRGTATGAPTSRAFQNPGCAASVSAARYATPLHSHSAPTARAAAPSTAGCDAMCSRACCSSCHSPFRADQPDGAAGELVAAAAAGAAAAAAAAATAFPLASPSAPAPGAAAAGGASSASAPLGPVEAVAAPPAGVGPGFVAASRLVGKHSMSSRSGWYLRGRAHPRGWG